MATQDISDYNGWSSLDIAPRYGQGSCTFKIRPGAIQSIDISYDESDGFSTFDSYFGVRDYSTVELNFVVSSKDIFAVFEEGNGIFRLE